ncbi:MAG: colicin D domain-containing protein [Chloroflexota bacterium]
MQKKFKHASVLGVEGNYNPENAQQFMDAVRAYINDPAVEQIVGTYRGDPVIHYYDKERKINAMTKRDGMFVSIWSLDDDQIPNLEDRGSL